MDFKRAGVAQWSVLHVGAEGPAVWQGLRDTPEVRGQPRRGGWRSESGNTKLEETEGRS